MFITRRRTVTGLLTGLAEKLAPHVTLNPRPVDIIYDRIVELKQVDDFSKLLGTFLRKFKSGGFRLALETGAPILPVAIDGTRRILPAKGLVVQRHQRVVVTILPPIDPAPYGLERRKELMRDVRAAIATALGQDPSEEAHGVFEVEAR